MINQGNWQGILEVMSCLLVSYACDIGPLAIHSVVENVASRLYKKQVSLEPQFSIWKPCRQRIAIKVPGRWGACSPTGWATACDQTPTGLTDLTIDTFTRWIVFFALCGCDRNALVLTLIMFHWFLGPHAFCENFSFSIPGGIGSVAFWAPSARRRSFSSSRGRYCF